MANKQTTHNTMGNLFTTKLSIESPDRAPMLKSVFEFQQLTKGMRQLSCDVVFGSPSANCVGTGICKISALVTKAKPKPNSRNCEQAPGLLMPLENGTGVSMVIAREMMCVKLLRNQFRNGILTLEGPYRLPIEIVSALSLEIKELKAGNYKVTEVNGFIRINFRTI